MFKKTFFFRISKIASHISNNDFKANDDYQSFKMQEISIK